MSNNNKIKFEMSCTFQKNKRIEIKTFNRQAAGDRMRLQLQAGSLHVHGAVRAGSRIRRESASRVPEGIPQGQVARIQVGLSEHRGFQPHFELREYCDGELNLIVVFFFNFVAIKFN